MYVIRVAGRSPDVGRRVGRPADHGAPAGATTELVRRFADQAALIGVLTTLYDLGLPPVSVACASAGRPADRT